MRGTPEPVRLPPVPTLTGIERCGMSMFLIGVIIGWTMGAIIEYLLRGGGDSP